MDICAIGFRSFDGVKSRTNVAAIFFFGFFTGFAECLLSVHNVLPSLSSEAFSTACNTYAGNRAIASAITIYNGTKICYETYGFLRNVRLLLLHSSPTQQVVG